MTKVMYDPFNSLSCESATIRCSLVVALGITLQLFGPGEANLLQWIARIALFLNVLACIPPIIGSSPRSGLNIKRTLPFTMIRSIPACSSCHVF